jgi:uncharacterized protein YbjT (DUF2867 family)
MSPALVIGAHGRTGRLVVDELVASGHQVIGTVRRAEHIDALRKAGAGGEVLDLLAATRDDLHRLMVGVHAVVYAAGSSADSSLKAVSQIDGESIIRAVDAAVLAGVRRFVLVSAHRTDEDFGGPRVVHLLRAKRAADAHLRETTLDWTIFRPDALTERPPTGGVRLDTTVPQGALPRADLAHLVRVALESPAAVHKQLEVTGGPTPIESAFDTLPFERVGSGSLS